MWWQVQLGQLLHLHRAVLVVRQTVVGVGNAQLGIGPRADLARHHERDDPGHVGLQREHLQVEHQPRMLGERIRDAAGGPGQLGQLDVALRLGELNAPLDVTDRVEVLVHLVAVGRGQGVPEAVDLVHQRVENAAVLADAGQPGRLTRVVGIAEQPLEHRPRLVLHRQRGGRVAPGQGVGVRAAPARLARADQFVRVHTELQRRELGVLSDLRGCESGPSTCRRGCPVPRSSWDALRSGTPRRRAHGLRCLRRGNGNIGSLASPLTTVT